jgi:hypothetical protein
MTLQTVSNSSGNTRKDRPLRANNGSKSSFSNRIAVKQPNQHEIIFPVCQAADSQALCIPNAYGLRIVADSRENLRKALTEILSFLIMHKYKADIARAIIQALLTEGRHISAEKKRTTAADPNPVYRSESFELSIA